MGRYGVAEQRARVQVGCEASVPSKEHGPLIQRWSQVVAQTVGDQ